MPSSLQKGSNLNSMQKGSPFKHSHFNYLKSLAFTPRFGELTPFYCEDSVPTDHMVVRPHFDLRTYTLKSPLMQDLKMYKSHFHVPISAILPFNYDKVISTPNQGDDVPVDAGTFSDVSYILQPFINHFDNLGVYTGLYDLMSLLKLISCCEHAFSSDGLFNTLGYSLPYIDWANPPSGLKSLSSVLKPLMYGKGAYMRVFAQDDFGNTPLFVINLDTISPNSWSDLFVDYVFDFFQTTINWEAVYNAVSQVAQVWVDVLRDMISLSGTSHDTAVKVDLNRIWSYQLVCVEFFTNDRVDYIYDAETFRAYIGSLVSTFGGIYSGSFDWNGYTLNYDFLSSHFYHLMYDIQTLSLEMICYLCALFGRRRSLRYKDYFSNARTRPIAVGDDNVSVTAGEGVSVIDITRKIQWQKFSNQVNRSGRKISQYLKSIFGADMKRSYDCPIFLGETMDVVYGSETQNTASEQFTRENNITTNLHCRSNDFAFDYTCDRFGCFISLVWFDFERFYSQASERQTMKADKFDLYNPYYQYIGDQNIEVGEFVKGAPANLNFGYTSRNMEYKTAFARVVGGFLSDLPSWLFINNDKRFVNIDSVGGSKYPTINVEFIRSLPSELDEYYLSLNADNPQQYFHFIIVARVSVSATRPMSIDPQILG